MSTFPDHRPDHLSEFKGFMIGVPIGTLIWVVLLLSFWFTCGKMFVSQ